MPITEKLSLRINGQRYDHIKMRMKMEGGYPGGPWEVVIPDDFFGPIILTDDFTIDLQEDGGEWEPVTLAYLIGMLESHRD
jgi:hypothetical protein